jgi:formate hydrogenlyase subunit 4
MMILGIGAGAAFAPLTVAGVSGVAPEDAGAASGLVNVAHQLGGSLGLAVLVTVFASAAPAGVESPEALAHQVSVALTAGTAMLVLALLVGVALTAWPRRREALAENVLVASAEAEVLAEAA